MGTTTFIWATCMVRKRAKFYLRLQYWLLLWFLPLIFINNLVYQPPFLYFLCSSLYLRDLSPGNYISRLSLLPPLWICSRLCQWNAWIRNLEVATSLTGMVVDTEAPRHKVMFSSVSLRDWAAVISGSSFLQLPDCRISVTLAWLENESWLLISDSVATQLSVIAYFK